MFLVSSFSWFLLISTSLAGSSVCCWYHWYCLIRCRVFLVMKIKFLQNLSDELWWIYTWSLENIGWFVSSGKSSNWAVLLMMILVEFNSKYGSSYLNSILKLIYNQLTSNKKHFFPLNYFLNLYFLLLTAYSTDHFLLVQLNLQFDIVKLATVTQNYANHRYAMILKTSL